MNTRSLLLCLALAAGALAAPARAERADRDKPVNLEADRVTIDDRNKIHTFEGHVTLTQGTLVIRAARLVVTQDVEGFQKAVAHAPPGGLAYLRQKREGKDEFIEGEAERIEYDGRTEQAQFFNRAYVKSGQDVVRGQYIRYDALSDNYLATSGPNATVASTPGGRVRMMIQPKAKEGSGGGNGDSTAGAAPLTPSPELSNPRQE